MYRSRKLDNRDLKIIITSRDSQTGTGKTTLALWLALHFDEYGFQADQVTLHPEEFLELYKENPAGSVIIMDEAEQLDSRRSMSNKNVEFWNLWQTMRYRQITSILTLPTRSALDKRGLELADVWIQVTERGHARVHKIGVGDYDGKTQPKITETLSFPDISDLQLKDEIDEKKVALMEEGEEFSKDEGEILDPEKIRKEERDRVMKNYDELLDVASTEHGEATGISPRQARRILSEG
jgi:Rad3-related DNA helicase